MCHLGDGYKIVQAKNVFKINAIFTEAEINMKF